ncbi:MAG: universal stress protein [Pseudomonadota bacterium]
MRRFKNILAVYHDDFGSDDVFTQSVSLAKANNARLTLLEVIQDRYATTAWVQEREKRLKRLVPAMHAAGVTDAHVATCVGTPFIEIIKHVLRNGHDLVIASPEQTRTDRGFYAGTTIAHLVRKSPCPVWSVKPDSQGHYSRILACVDPKTGDNPDDSLDIKLLQLASSLAEANGAELHVVHAWEVEGPDRDRLRSELPDKTREEIMEKHQAMHRGRVQRVMDQLPSFAVEPTLHLPKSEPHDAIVDLVRELSVDLVVMGSVNRTGISGFFIGSAAEGVLTSVRCSLLTVKPEGFRTPVVLDDYPSERVGSL